MVFAGQGPKLYHDLFEKEEENSTDEAIYFPETEAEFRSMVAQMQREGTFS